MFLFKLNKQKKRAAKKYINKSVSRQIDKEDLINKWVKGESNFDKTIYIDLWEKYRKLYGDKFLHEVLKTMAISNAVVDVNHILQYNMAMPNAILEADPINSILAKTLNVSIAKMVLKEAGLGKKPTEEALSRIVAREFPLKHERIGQPPIQIQPQVPQMPQMPQMPILPQLRQIRRSEKNEL